ncbi:MAG: nucleotide exchange factor GrpE [Acidobacteriota bacterium]
MGNIENTEQPSKPVSVNFDRERATANHTDEKTEAVATENAHETIVTKEAEVAEEDAPEIELLEEESEQQPAAEQQGQGLTPAEVAQILIDLSDAQERSAKLTEEKRLLYEQLMRRQAEFENFRKRVERERTETYGRARADMVTELLPILDNLERAINSGAQSEKSEGVQESILEGVKLIHRQFLDLLNGFGLAPIKAVGKPFDPHLHEAVTTEPNDELPENTVVAELQRGYKLGDRLLRPAMVKVTVRN